LLSHKWCFATDIWFAGNLNTKQLIRQWIDSDENIAKLGWYYSSSIISAVFRPDNVNFIVTQMTCLYKSKGIKQKIISKRQVHQHLMHAKLYFLKESILVVRRHSSRYVKDHFRQRSGKVRGRFTGRTVPLQTTKKASVRFQFNLTQPNRRIIICYKFAIYLRNLPPMLIQRQSLRKPDFRQNW
jgi:hypothetical protein